MATRKPMKKFKRYDEGGSVGESAAKQRGLDISNKEEPVGFFERIRMGNIDQPGTEAYNRFGAGRGYEKTMEDENEAMRAANRAPSAPAASSRPLSDDMYSDFGPSEGRSSSETVKPTRQVMTKPTLPASKPTATPAAPVPRLRDTGPTRGDLINKPSLDTNYSNEGRGKPAPATPAKPSMNVPEMRENAKKALDEDPTALLGTGAGAAAAALLARSKLGKLFKGAKKAADKSPYLKELPMEKKKLGRAASDVTDVVAKKRGGKVMKYASGGMVGSASRRADGIASKGKTRCKIC